MALLIATLLAAPFDHIYSDNMAAVWTATSTRRSSQPTMQLLTHLLTHSKSLAVHYINTMDNPADPASRPKSDFSCLQTPQAGEKYRDAISRQLKSLFRQTIHRKVALRYISARPSRFQHGLGPIPEQ
jgi:hypothetical protein